MSQDTNQQHEWPWATVFMEVVLRAMRRLHYEYGLWGIGPHWKMDRQRAGRINTGPGIELADERTVCAAITQEFIGSPALAGVWVENRGDGGKENVFRRFEIDRETSYQSVLDTRVDLFVKKYIQRGDRLGDDWQLVDLPSFIEAKRAYLCTPDITSGGSRRWERQQNKVADDVARLRNEIQHRKHVSVSEQIRGHVLVWGVFGDEMYQAHPQEFFGALELVELHALRWLPLRWEQPSRGNLDRAVSKLGIPPTDLALWIGLAEVVTATTGC